MSDEITAAMVEKFLAIVRAKSQWYENKQVLAPGEITPYLKSVMTAAFGTLAIKTQAGRVDQMRLESAQGAPMCRWHVFTLGDTMFDMEGPTTLAKVEKVLAGQMANNTMALVGPCQVKVAPPTNFSELFANATGTGLRVIGIANAAWAEAVEAPLLQAHTARSVSMQPKFRL